MNSAGSISHPALRVLRLFMDEFGGVESAPRPTYFGLFMDEFGGVESAPGPTRFEDGYG